MVSGDGPSCGLDWSGQRACFTWQSRRAEADRSFSSTEPVLTRSIRDVTGRALDACAGTQHLALGCRLEIAGTLHIVRQPPLDSLTAGLLDRLQALKG
jgi:hypothetical protein